MKKYLWLIGGLGLLGVYILTRRSLAKNLIFNITNIRLKGTLLRPIIELSFNVQNPTNQKATLKGIAGNLSLNGNVISNVSNFTEQTISARGESILSIDVRPTIIGIGTTLYEIITGKTKSGSFTFDGSANVDGIVLPINIRYDL